MRSDAGPGPLGAVSYTHLDVYKRQALGMGFPKDYQTVAVSASPDAVTALNGGQSDFGVKDIYASVKGQ